MRATRRDVLRGLAAAGVGVVTGLAVHGTVFERHRLLLVNAEMPVSGLPPALDGLRVGLLTDVHHSAMVSETSIAHAVSRLLAATPDLVALGGDYVTFADRRYISPAARLLQPLTAAPHGAFAVLGNHDDEQAMARALASAGIVVLADQRTSLTVRGERLDIAGVRYWTRQVKDLARVLRGAGATTLLLAHDPRRLTEAALFGVPAVLSGHTHGGQVVLPGVGALAARRFPVLSGLARREQTSLFVSRGVGTVYLPLRVDCPPDVSVITLRRYVES